MNFLISMISLISAVSTNPKIDTVDYWHVYYNKKEIAQYNQQQVKRLIVIKIKDIKAGDILSVKYGDDTPCEDCTTGLYIVDANHKETKLVEGRGTFNSLNISVSTILEIWKRSGQKNVDFYYFDERRDRYIFQLKFIN